MPMLPDAAARCLFGSALYLEVAFLRRTLQDARRAKDPQPQLSKLPSGWLGAPTAAHRVLRFLLASFGHPCRP